MGYYLIFNDIVDVVELVQDVEMVEKDILRTYMFYQAVAHLIQRLM